MLEVIRENGEIVSCCEFYVVDAQGNYCKDGKYIWVNQLETSKSKEGNTYKYVQHYIKRITTVCPQAEFGYFSREKYQRRIRMYHKRRWLRLFKGMKWEEN